MKRPILILTDSKSQAILGGEPYQGYSNSATWMFDLYMGQERPYNDKMAELVTGAALDEALCTKVYHFFNRLPIRLDDWASGQVNVKEIVGWWHDEYNRGDTPNPPHTVEESRNL